MISRLHQSQKTTTLDHLFLNVPYIPQGDCFEAKWSYKAKIYREKMLRLGRVTLNVAYGIRPRQKLDIFLPHRPPVGLMVFVHGGFWMKTDKSFWSYLAHGFVENGYIVILPSYTIAPHARISEMVLEIAKAVIHSLQIYPYPLSLCGHSAGAHLVSRLICPDTPLPDGVLKRIQKLTFISGLYDLHPFLQTRMNKVLGLTKAEALQESSYHHCPLLDAPLVTLVGADERAEFLRQSELLHNSWRSYLKSAVHTIEPKKNHFTILDALTTPCSKMMQTVLHH